MSQEPRLSLMRYDVVPRTYYSSCVAIARNQPRFSPSIARPFLVRDFSPRVCLVARCREINRDSLSRVKGIDFNLRLQGAPTVTCVLATRSAPIRLCVCVCARVYVSIQSTPSFSRHWPRFALAVYPRIDSPRLDPRGSISMRGM